ncbi:M15 family metallopeptidase [Lewinella sp. IMCC34183]|uniref:M15 family metallopeptidase n=1 Tax=Lewinella sp. IMCC34183 TaxID=2248762 RepID=UPI000E22300E|nr:M15 family metallopeptidase [Lewinella sp. IMCC34183]
MAHPFRALLLLSLLCACGPAADPPAPPVAFPVAVEPPPPPLPPAPLPPDYDSTAWTELVRLDSSFALDLRYATDSNFMKQQIYDCGRCFYRPKVARALLAVQQDLRSRGLGLKMFDCYRPGPYQQRLWDVLPDARYVARPTKGSVHSRGAAADLTIVDLATGEELDMGTPYDFFGEAAYTTTTDLPAPVPENRRILQEAMLRHGFSTIRTEWWHFNYGGPRFPLSDWVWACP